MKLALVKTFICLLAHLVVQKDIFSTANDLYNNKRYPETIEICTGQINKLNVKDTLYEKFLLLRATAYLVTKDYTPAIKDYTMLIKIKPNDAKYYVGLSYLYGSTQQYKNCLGVLATALQFNPKDIYVLNNLSYYSNQIGSYDDGIRYADDGLKYVTELSWKGALLNNRGYGYIGLKHYQEALDDIDQSIKLNPENPFAYCYRAIANIHLKRMTTVCDDLTKAKNLGAISLTENLIKENCTN